MRIFMNDIILKIFLTKIPGIHLFAGYFLPKLQEHISKEKRKQTFLKNNSDHFDKDSAET